MTTHRFRAPLLPTPALYPSLRGHMYQAATGSSFQPSFRHTQPWLYRPPFIRPTRQTNTYTRTHNTQRTTNRQDYITTHTNQAPDQNTRLQAKHYFKLVQATHHKEIVDNAITTNTYPMGMTRQVTRLTEFIKPSSPTEDTKALIALCTTQWLEQVMKTLQTHYTRTIEKSLQNLPQPANRLSLQIAMGWADKRYGQRLTSTSREKVHTLTNIFPRTQQPPSDIHPTPPVTLATESYDVVFPPLPKPHAPVPTSSVVRLPRLPSPRSFSPHLMGGDAESKQAPVPHPTPPSRVGERRLTTLQSLVHNYGMETVELSQEPTGQPTSPPLVEHTHTSNLCTSTPNSVHSVKMANFSLQFSSFSSVPSPPPQEHIVPLLQQFYFPSPPPRLNSLSPILPQPLPSPPPPAPPHDILLPLQTFSLSPQIPYTPPQQLRYRPTTSAVAQVLHTHSSQPETPISTTTHVSSYYTRSNVAVILEEAVYPLTLITSTGGAGGVQGASETRWCGENGVEKSQMMKGPPKGKIPMKVHSDPSQSTAPPGDGPNPSGTTLSIPLDIQPEAPSLCGPRTHRSEAGKKIQTWNIHSHKNVHILGDSNVGRIPPYANSNIQIDSYPGATYYYFSKILEKTPVQPGVEWVVLSVGLNNKDLEPYKTSIKQMQQMHKHSLRVFPNAKVYIPIIQFSDYLTSTQQTNLTILNTYVREHFHYIAGIPQHTFFTANDNIHWTQETARNMYRQWCRVLNLI